MPDVHKLVSGGLLSAALPVATALVGVAAARADSGPARWLLITLLLALCVAAGGLAWRARRAAADAEQVAAEHRMLRESIENTPMPYAVYDNHDVLIAWNKAYESTHAEAFRLLGARGRLNYGDLVRVTAEATLPADQVSGHVAQRLRQQRQADGVAVDREYPGLGWLRVCKFATPSGAVAGFAVDINELKQREAALQAQIALSDRLASQLRELADTDALTGTRNRRAFFERAADEFQRSRRYGHPLSVAMIDIDDFKAVNDGHGHGAGDQVLARVADTCRAQLRACTDCCGRLGGEEFAILLPETDQAGATVFAERLCAAVRGLRFEAAGRSFGVSVSIGVAAMNDLDEGFAALLARADAALYRAKSAGRDRVMLAAA